MGLSLSFRVWVSRGKCGKKFRGRMSGGYLRPLAATRVAASGRGKCGRVSGAGCQAATCGRPLAGTCGHSSGCKWLPLRKECWRPLAAICGAGDKRMLAAICGHSSGCKWLQVAASGCKWLQVAASGCKWLQVAASGCKWLQVAAGNKRMLAPTCGHSSGCKCLLFPKLN